MVAEGYKDTEIGVIPAGWEVKTLEDICIKKGLRRGPFGGALKKDIFVSEGYKIYEQKNAIKQDLEIGRYYITAEKYNEMEAFQVKENDFLISCSGTIGKIVKVSSPYKEGIINQALLKLTLNDIINDNFFQFQFNSRRIQSLIIDNTQGGAMPNLVSMSIFRNTKFVIPPLNEQEKIADILSTTDDKINAISIQIEKAETLKKGLLQKLLSEGIGHSEFKDSELGKIPASWDIIPFLELADKKVKHSFTGGPFGSDLKSEHYTDKGVRVIQLQNIGDGSFLNNDFVYTSEEKAEALKTCQIYPNDIILAKMAEPVARACIIPNIESKYLMGSDGIRLHIDKSKYDTHFIFQSINHNRFRNIAIARSTGTTRLRIGLTALKKIPIAIPPLEEQKQIAEILSTADEKLEVLRAKKEKYETLKKGLLQKLLSGEVRV